MNGDLNWIYISVTGQNGSVTHLVNKALCRHQKNSSKINKSVSKNNGEEIENKIMVCELLILFMLATC